VVVGVCRITFSIPGNDSLKGKRRVLRRIVDRTRNQFNAAVAEVGALDEHRRALVGFAVVSNDSRHANSMLDTISGFVSGLTEAVVLDRSIELLHVGDGGGDRRFDDAVPEDGDEADWREDLSEESDEP
jgi:uncharacterized protein YlxP (DUF503 family)